MVVTSTFDLLWPYPTCQHTHLGGWFTHDPCGPGRDANPLSQEGPRAVTWALGSGPVNSMVNIMNRPQVAALGPHVLCNLGGGYSPTATVARVSFFEGSPSGHKPNSSDASVSSVPGSPVVGSSSGRQNRVSTNEKDP